MKTLRPFGLLLAIVLASGLTTSCGSSKTAATATDIASKAGLGDVLSSSFGSLGTILASITGLESARAAVPKLDKLNADVADIQKQAASLAPDAQKSLSDIVAAQLPPVKTALDKAYAVPGVREVIQPSMDSLLAKYAKF